MFLDVWIWVLREDTLLPFGTKLLPANIETLIYA